jgi:4-amino-4-deoxy-L-arabinose transferase-like glycosyltransferase
MTVVTLPRTRPLAASTDPGRLRQVRAHLVRHRADLLTVAALLLIVGLAQGINFDGYPFRLNDDEGTYGAQALAFLQDGHLSHYTYWYDHPPFGWMTIAGYAWVTDGFDRAPTVVTVVRETMLLATLAACAFLYLLMRRIDITRHAAAAAVLLFGLSPVAIFFHRLGFLDNLETAWALAAFAIAAGPHRGLGCVFASALCFAAATLTKETAGILLPAFLWFLAQRHRPGSRGLGVRRLPADILRRLLPLPAVRRPQE